MLSLGLSRWLNLNESPCVLYTTKPLTSPIMDTSKSVITLTFGDCAENHKGMEMIGKTANAGEGFTIDDLREIKAKFEVLGCVANLHMLNTLPEQAEAGLLVIKNAVDVLLRKYTHEETKTTLTVEQAEVLWDKKAFMYGRVVNKHARWNVCYSETGHEPAYETGKGRVIAYDEVPVLQFLRDEVLPVYFGPKAQSLKCEGNYYYDIETCGIGFHGDSERRKVIAVRLGASLPIHYQWYHEGAPVGERMVFGLDGGDMYVMSEKTVGTDWKCKKIHTLRHATGCSKFTA